MILACLRPFSLRIQEETTLVDLIVSTSLPTLVLWSPRNSLISRRGKDDRSLAGREGRCNGQWPRCGTGRKGRKEPSAPWASGSSLDGPRRWKLVTNLGARAERLPRADGTSWWRRHRACGERASSAFGDAGEAQEAGDLERVGAWKPTAAATVSPTGCCQGGLARRLIDDRGGCGAKGFPADDASEPPDWPRPRVAGRGVSGSGLMAGGPVVGPQHPAPRQGRGRARAGARGEESDACHGTVAARA